MVISWVSENVTDSIMDIWHSAYSRYNGEPYNKARILNTIPVAGALSGNDSKPYIQRGRYIPGLNVQAQMVRLWNATDGEPALQTIPMAHILINF